MGLCLQYIQDSSVYELQILKKTILKHFSSNVHENENVNLLLM